MVLLSAPCQVLVWSGRVLDVAPGVPAALCWDRGARQAVPEHLLQLSPRLCMGKSQGWTCGSSPTALHSPNTAPAVPQVLPLHLHPTEPRASPTGALEHLAACTIPA